MPGSLILSRGKDFRKLTFQLFNLVFPILFRLVLCLAQKLPSSKKLTGVFIFIMIEMEKWTIGVHITFSLPNTEFGSLSFSTE